MDISFLCLIKDQEIANKINYITINKEDKEVIDSKNISEIIGKKEQVERCNVHPCGSIVEIGVKLKCNPSECDCRQMYKQKEGEVGT